MLDPTDIVIQKGTCLDLKCSGSILLAGKTRSGKTTAALSILGQIAVAGPDKYGSRIDLIDPKCAELSMLPHATAPSLQGDARPILSTLKAIDDIRISRQQHLNGISKQTGNVAHWWTCGMHPCIVFIDEWVSARALFPKKVDKADPEYCLNSFDTCVKRLVTMGQSAGVFVMISTAEASVEEAGIPAMIRSAMTTKILLRPTLEEGALLWDRKKIEGFPERRYQAGDAWFSSTDGIHDNVTFVQFPALEFSAYREMGQLLARYYEGDRV